MSQVTLAPCEVAVPDSLALLVHVVSDPAPARIGAAMTSAFQRLGAVLGSEGLEMAAPPRAIYTDVSPERVCFTVAIPIAGPPGMPAPETDVEVSVLPGGRALRFTHRGPYDQLAATYREVTEWLKDQKLIDTEADWSRYMPMWEEYVSDPDCTPAPELVTQIYLPLK